MEQKFREIIAFNIKIERIRKKLTQEALAELAGVSTKHLTKIEKARVTPSSFLLYSLAKALEVSIEKLMTENI